MCTCRVDSSMTKSTYSCLSPTVSTVKKSVASTLWAWERRNSAQVGPPRGAGPRPARRRTRRFEGGRHADPELSQLALDADTSPASVLTCQPNDEFDQLGAHRRSTGATLLPPPAPLVLGRFPVPPQQRVRGDEKRLPPCPRQQPAECSEDGSIGRAKANPGV